MHANVRKVLKRERCSSSKSAPSMRTPPDMVKISKVSDSRRSRELSPGTFCRPPWQAVPIVVLVRLCLRRFVCRNSVARARDRRFGIQFGELERHQPQPTITALVASLCRPIQPENAESEKSKETKDRKKKKKKEQTEKVCVYIPGCPRMVV